jgi:hypothetical protein
MTTKKADLDKQQGKAIVNAQRRSGNPHGAAALQGEDRKARRERERAAGLVPFAAKLPKDLVAALQQKAQAASRHLDDVTAELLREALAPEGK